MIAGVSYHEAISRSSATIQPPARGTLRRRGNHEAITLAINLVISLAIRMRSHLRLELDGDEAAAGVSREDGDAVGSAYVGKVKLGVEDRLHVGRIGAKAEVGGVSDEVSVGPLRPALPARVERARARKALQVHADEVVRVGGGGKAIDDDGDGVMAHGAFAFVGQAEGAVHVAGRRGR